MRRRRRRRHRRRRRRRNDEVQSDAVDHRSALQPNTATLVHDIFGVKVYQKPCYYHQPGLRFAVKR